MQRGCRCKHTGARMGPKLECEKNFNYAGSMKRFAQHRRGDFFLVKMITVKKAGKKLKYMINYQKILFLLK